MGKICVIKSCPSGRKSKQNRDTAQPLSYFHATNPTRIKNWQKSLGMNIKASDGICHLHFKQEHIKMYDEIVINGELKVFPTLKNMLRDEALPTIEHQFIPKPVDDHELTPINEWLPIDHDYFLEIQHDNEQRCSDIDSVEYDTIETFKNNIGKVSMPPLWLYILNNETGLEFMRMNSETRQIINHIRLNEDLSITVIFPDNSELLLDEKINSCKNIQDYLKSVERWPQCVGTGFNSHMYSDSCKGVIVGDEAYIRQQIHPRCKSCRVLRNRLQNRFHTHNLHSNISEEQMTEEQYNFDLGKQSKRFGKIIFN